MKQAIHARFPLKPGGQSAVVPPGPVPNPEVKRCRANGSRTIGPARVGRRRDFFHQAPSVPQLAGLVPFLLSPSLPLLRLSQLLGKQRSQRNESLDRGNEGR